MKAIVLITLIFSGLNIYGQDGKLKKANNYYEKIAYAEAIPLYLDLLGSAYDSPELKSKLGSSYYQMGNTQKSEEFYSQVVLTEMDSEDVYNYAQSLKENGKHQASDELMEKFHYIEPSDSRGIKYIENKTYIQSIESQEAYFSIKHLNINTKNTEFGGYPNGDGKVYFVSNSEESATIKRYHTWNNGVFLDLYSADIDKDLELKNATLKSKKINKKYHEGSLCFAPDGKSVYFTRNNMDVRKKRRDENGIQNLKIYSAEVDAEGNWINEQQLAINSKEFSIGHPAISSDGKVMYFTSDMPGGFGGADIYSMSINGDGTYGSPENLGSKINTEGQEMFPWITSEKLLFFASDGHLGLGGLDIFVMLPNKDGSFKKLMNVGRPVNSAKDDFALVMNTDGKTGFVSSNRETGVGGDDIYGFNLLKPLKVNLSVKGVVTDVRSNEIIAQALVNLLDSEGNILATVTADEKGNYEFDVEPDTDYRLAVSTEKYFDNSNSFTTKNLENSIEVIQEDVLLEKDPGLSLFVLITDNKDGTPIEGVTILLVDNITGESETLITNTTGDYLKALNDKKLDDKGSYNISLSKDGFIPKTVTYNTVFLKEGQYDVSAQIDISMDKMVEDLRDLIKINPINFNLGKWNIRADAKIELNKIIEVMNKYPVMEVELRSHTDCRASKAFNMKLSDKRAKSSAKYIQSKITNPKRIYGKGYGESQLLNECECEGSVKADCSEEEHEENRRTEFKVISVGVQ